MSYFVFGILFMHNSTNFLTLSLYNFSIYFCFSLAAVFSASIASSIFLFSSSFCFLISSISLDFFCLFSFFASFAAFLASCSSKDSAWILGSLLYALSVRSKILFLSSLSYFSLSFLFYFSIHLFSARSYASSRLYSSYWQKSLHVLKLSQNL